MKAYFERLREFFKRSRYGRLLAAFFCGLVLFVSVNVIAAFSFEGARMDLTESKLYSLSAPTKKILSSLKEPVVIRLYLSSDLTNSSALYSAYAARIIDFLEQYKNYGFGNVKLFITYLDPLSKEEMEAENYGLEGVSADGINKLFLGAVVSNMADGFKAVSLLDMNEEKELEYRLTKAISDIVTAKRPVLGLVSDIPIDGVGRKTDLGMTPYQPRWDVMEQIRKSFDVYKFSMRFAEIPKEVDVLMLVNPRYLLSSTLEAIDRFVQRGGRMIVFLDPFSEVENDRTAPFAEYDVSIRKLLTAWGIAYSSDEVVLDLSNARDFAYDDNNPSLTVKFVLWPEITERGMDSKNPITASLSRLTFGSPGYFSFLPLKVGDAFTRTVLASSSPNAGLIPKYKLETIDPMKLLKEFSSQDHSYVFIAELSGELPSPFTGTRSKPTSVVLVADTDFLHPAMYRTAEGAFSSNADFILNALDILANKSDLLALRSKKEWRRPLSEVETLKKAVQLKYQDDEQDLRVKIEEAKERIQKLEGSKRASSSEVLLAVQKESRELSYLVYSLRELRAKAANDTRARLSAWQVLTAFPTPVLTAVCGMVLYLARRRRRKRSYGGRHEL